MNEEKKLVGRPQKEKQTLVSMVVKKETRQLIKELSAKAGLTMQVYLAQLVDKVK